MPSKPVVIGSIKPSRDNQKVVSLEAATSLYFRAVASTSRAMASRLRAAGHKALFVPEGAGPLALVPCIGDYNSDDPSLVNVLGLKVVRGYAVLMGSADMDYDKKGAPVGQASLQDVHPRFVEALVVELEKFLKSKGV